MDDLKRPTFWIAQGIALLVLLVTLAWNAARYPGRAETQELIEQGLVGPLNPPTSRTRPASRVSSDATTGTWRRSRASSTTCPGSSKTWSWRFGFSPERSEMSPLERYLFVFANVELPPNPNPSIVEIEVLGWATDWPSVQLQQRIANFLNELFARVGAIEATLDPSTINAALEAVQDSAAAAAASAAHALTEAANAAAAGQAAAAAQASTNALAAMGHAQSSATSATAASNSVAALEARLAAAEARLTTLEAPLSENARSRAR
jgi:hypothetical protein